jgi:hypothetical protein
MKQPSGRNFPLSLRAEEGAGPFQGVKNFFAELDAFIDDASARRLGNGAAFYGKRKSNFYGEKDKMRKTDRDTPDPTEDYQGPSGAGYFKWMPDENGELDDRCVWSAMLSNPLFPPQLFAIFQAD